MEYKVIFRCDAAYIKGIGSGHLIRCIVIAKILEKKFNFKKKDFLFIIKSHDKFKLGKKIIKKYRYNFLSIKNKIKKKNEIKILSKFKSNLLVVDKYKFYDSSTYNTVKKKIKKLILIDAYKKSYKNIKYLNPTFNKGSRSKSPVLIIPSLLLKNFPKKKTNKNIKKIFIFFGNYDFNNSHIKIIKILNKIGNFNIYVHINNKPKLKKIKKKIYFYDEKNFFNSLKKSDLAITSGGLVMYDVMNLNTPLILLPQIKHQIINSRYYEQNKCLISVLNNTELKKNFINKFKIINDRKFRYSMIKRQQKVFSNKERRKIFNILKKCI